MPTPPPPPYLLGDRVQVTLVGESDAGALLDFHRRNRDHLRPWSPPAPSGFLTHGYWQRWTAAARPLYDQDQAVRLVLRWHGEVAGPVLGQMSLSQIQRGPFQAALLGYQLDEHVQGQGLMQEALRLVLDFALGPLSLHRIAANHLPENQRSARLLARLGFEIEGRARSYLFIDGAWRDHILTALTNPDAPPPDPDAPAHPVGWAAGTVRRR